MPFFPVVNEKNKMKWVRWRYSLPFTPAGVPKLADGRSVQYQKAVTVQFRSDMKMMISKAVNSYLLNL